MKTWQQLTHYAGFDWARDHHDIVVVDGQGRIVAQFRISHNAAGWEEFRQKIAVYPAVGVVIETSQGAAVDQLLQMEGLTVYPVHPVAAQHYRQRKAPSGNKTDRVDAWSLADALRLDGSQWKALQAMDPLPQELRLLCRDEMSLIEQRTALVNQLQQALNEYYPAAVAAFDDWTRPATWEFVIEFPTPEILLKRKRSRWEKFLHKHKLWRPQTADKRLEIFAGAGAFCASAAVTSAKSLLAVSLARLLRALQNQLDNTAVKSKSSLRNIRTAVSSVPCPERRATWLRVSWAKSRPRRSASTSPKPCNVWPGPVRSATNPVKSTRSISAINAAKSCVISFTFGPIAPDTPPLGFKPTMRRSGPREKATPVPCVASASDY